MIRARARRALVAGAIGIVGTGFCQTRPAFAAQQTANWLGGNGTWSTAAQWSGGVVPNNNATDTYNVNIDNGNVVNSVVTLGSAPGSPLLYNVDNLTIDAGDRLYLDNGSLNVTGAIVLNGTLQLDYTSAVTLPANSIVTGNGTVKYSLQTSQLSAASGSLTIAPNITVSGGGSNATYYSSPYAQIGSTATALVNQGLIRADTVAGMLTISASSLDNQGTIQVAANSFLNFNTDFSLATIGNLVNSGGTIVISKTLQNTGQTLTATAPRQWALRGTINGGTVASSGTGYVEVNYLDTATFNNVTLNGKVRYSGNINVTGTFGGNGTLQLVNPEALQGSGNVTIGTVPAGITIRGGIDSSFDDSNKARITLTSNKGTIRAEESLFNGPGRLRIIGNVTNTGSLETDPSGTLTCVGNLTFGLFGKLVIDGGGLLEVGGDLDLSTLGDTLDVRPKPGGGAYSRLIATYTGTLSGTFTTVTSGITVNYGTPGQISISGTPVPEPGAIGCVWGTGAWLVSRRRQRRGER